MAKRLIGDAVVVLGLGSVSWYLWQEYNRSNKSKPSNPVIITSKNQTNGIVVKESAREFLNKKATEGDDLVKKTIKNETIQQVTLTPPPFVEEFKNEEFRFDVTPNGLMDTLHTILETKRSLEKSMIETARRTGNYPSDFAENMKDLRKDKAEIKVLLKRLQKELESS